MIGGFFNRLTSTLPPDRVLRPFLRAILLRWPRAYIDVTDFKAMNRMERFRGGRMPERFPDHGHLFIVRDREMELHEEMYGRTLDKRRESGLSIEYSRISTDEYDYNLVTGGRFERNRFSRAVVMLLIDIADATFATFKE